MASRFLLLFTYWYIILPKAAADCTVTYNDYYPGNLVSSFDACKSTCDNQGGICGSAFYQASTGACVTIDCIDDTFSLDGWTVYTVSGAEKCPNPIPWTPSAEPASTVLEPHTIVDPAGTAAECTGRPKGTSAQTTLTGSGSPVTMYTSAAPTGAGNSSPSKTPTSTSTSSAVVPTSTPNAGSFGAAGLGGLASAGFFLMVAFFV